MIIAIMKVLFVFVFMFFTNTNCLTRKEAEEYLVHYRHMKASNPEDYVDGLKDFQKHADIPVTGELDADTKKMMKTPRCFNPNDDWMEADNRVKRYTYFHGKWTRRHLTYHMIYPNSVSRNIVQQGLRRAFDVWSRYSGLTFSEISVRMNAHLKMKFDYFSTATTLGYAYYPPVGVLVFSNRFTWTLESSVGTNFYQVALHQIGHALGLGHTKVRGASLYAYHMSNDPNFILHSDDIAGITSLYRTSVII